MGKIIATGKLYGELRTLTVELREGKPEILETELRELFQHDLDIAIQNQQPIGGTYYPPPETLLAAYNVLNHFFFTELQSLEVIGEIEEIPYTEGLIY